MKLQQEIEDFNKLTLKMSALEKNLISQEKLNIINSKNEQLEQLRKEGWSKQEVLSKLLEITWDVSADFRDNRHQNKEVSKELNDFMLYLAKIILIKDNNILDVGCGDGILIKYLNMMKNDHLINSRITGIDLSQNVLNYAIKNYPEAKFYKMNFLDFKSPSTEKYSTIVFNECLHNFLNLTDTLKYASNILDNQGQIIVSHPRGYDNIFNQYNKNRWLVPSLLPNNDIEWNNILKDTNLKLIKNKLPSTSKSYLYILEHNN
jgi:2-polyprenyl-3-methyl-5-hydroxy-6-metoxy-1,4-benzoquinol methylase